MAKKPDWPEPQGTCGIGIIGLAAVKIMPPDGGGEVKVRYRIDSPLPGLVRSLQLVVVAAEAFNLNGGVVFQKQFLAFGRTRTGELYQTLVFAVTEPGLFYIVFGPYEGMVSIDSVGPTEPKLSLEVPDGSFDFVSDDLGDVIIAKDGDPLWFYIREFHIPELMEQLGFIDLGNGVPEVSLDQRAQAYSSLPDCIRATDP